MDSEKKAVFITLVTGRKQKDAVLCALRGCDVHLINVMYGKGAVKGNFLADMLGLTPEENKIVVSCITTCAKSDTVLNLLIDKFNFDKPNTGMAFTIPIEAISY